MFQLHTRVVNGSGSSDANCREKERIAFNYLTSQKYSGEQAVLDVWRDGEEVQLTIQLMRPRLLVPLHLDNTDPSFFVVAGQHCHLFCLHSDLDHT